MEPDRQNSDADVGTQIRGNDLWGVRRIEQRLSGLDGVTSLKVVPDEEGGIAEVHVVSDTDLGAKRIVRNIESALLAEFGLQIDHRKISVAQVKTPDVTGTPAEIPGLAGMSELDAEPDPDGSRRLLLDSLRIDRKTGREVTCRITFRGEEEDEYNGTAEGADFARSRLEVVARAVLDALNKATVSEIDLRLEGVVRFEACGHNLIVALVQGREGRRAISLPGVSVISDSPEEATALACLQATNRWASAS